MSSVRKHLSSQQDIESAVQRAAKSLAPTVVRVRFDTGFDATGEPSIFFRIVLSDKAAKDPKLSDTAQRISLKIMNEVRTDEKGLHAYFNFRSVSEQLDINEPAWA
jgi:hypothetical protein